MSFDYDSFLQGVMTGLKLGRPPKYRMPPEPIPEDSYMITEDDNRMITESGDYMVTE